MSNNTTAAITRRNFGRILGAGLASLLVSGCEGKRLRFSPARIEVINPPIEYPHSLGPGLDLIGDMEGAHRQDASVLSHDGLIHVVGGSEDWLWTWPTAKYSTFDPKTLEWDKRPPMPCELSHMAALVFDDKIMTVGGKRDDKNDFRSGPIVDNVFCYNSGNESWDIQKRFPSTIASAKAFVVDEVPHVIGGYTDFHHKKGTWWGTTYKPNLDIFMYDGSTGDWNVRTRLPKEVSWMTTVAKDSRIYVFGSRYNGQTENMESLAQIYDTGKDTWTEKLTPQHFDEMHAFVENDNLCLWVCEETMASSSAKSTRGHALFSSISDGKWDRENLSEVCYGVAVYTEKVIHNGDMYLLGPVHPGVGYDGRVFRLDLPEVSAT